MKNEGGGKFTHRTPISIDNPEVRSDKDWWDEVCRAHGAKNFWPARKKKIKKEKQTSDEQKVTKK